MMSDMINQLLLLCTLTATILCSGCAALINGECPVDARAPAKTIYLVSHGWHVGIVVNRVDIPDDVRLVHKDLSRTGYLEIGWGDRAFYQTPNPHLGITLKALLLPTPSVLHIVAFNDSVASFFPHSEIIRVRLSDAGFQRMIRYIAASYVRDPAGNLLPLGPGTLWRQSVLPVSGNVPFVQNLQYLGSKSIRCCRLSGQAIPCNHRG